MKNIKNQFSELRKTTPKHVQWLLLAAAFVVVLILLTLLIGGGKSDDADVGDVENGQKASLVVSPDGTIEWLDIPAGADTQSQQYTITATASAKIIGIRPVNKGEDLIIADKDNPCDTAEKSCMSVTQNCTTQTVNIDPQHGCRVTVKFYPKAQLSPTGVSLYLDYRGAREPDTMKESKQIMIVASVAAPKKEAAPEKAPKPTPAPVIEPQPTPVIIPEPEPEPIKQEIKKEVEAIAPPAPVFEAPKPAPAPQPAPAPVPEKKAEACSDFAFPGYNAAGRQIGWIKPDGGAYYFHPFSDTECKNATGIYNPDNGIISDIKDGSTKIGTDAEHIGYANVYDGALPQLSNPVTKKVNKAEQLDTPTNSSGMSSLSSGGTPVSGINLRPAPAEPVTYGTTGDVVVATQPYDRTFILRQYKPIPATIVSDVRADVALESGDKNLHFPVRATVDRNVYSDNGRTIIIPTGTLLLGYVTGEVPGPYKSIGRMNIKWYQFILPNGVEFNFADNEPVSADSQGRIGVPGRGSTDYLEQFVMPMLTSIVPAAINLISPVADRFVNQIDLDNNTVVQSGTVRSSELAKNEIITAWNQVAQKLMVDMMDNTVPPFTIPAGTRITVYSPQDLAVACTDDTKKCYMNNLAQKADTNRPIPKWDTSPADDDSWVGQVRSFDASKYCIEQNGVMTADPNCATDTSKCGGMDYRNLLFWCQSLNYKAVNQLKQQAVWENQTDVNNKNSFQNVSGGGSPTNLTKEYNENVLGLKYDDNGTIVNPFTTQKVEEEAPVITCPDDGALPDANGCCTGEIFTDMGEQGMNCCPEGGGDCFPPIQ